MIGADSNFLCSESKQHYYDFLYGREQKIILDYIVDHINRCQNCQRQLNQLKAALSEAQNLKPDQHQVSLTETTMLQLHLPTMADL